MATAVRCYSPIQGRTLRVTTVNACGVPVTGSGGGVIVMSDGFVQATMAAEIETGERKIRRSANGNLCVNFKLPDILVGLTLTMDFCLINPGLVSRTINARLLTCSESPTGTGFALAEGTATAHFSLEIWQDVAGEGACDASGQQRYVYNAWPHLFNARPGDYNINEDPSTLQIVADSLKVGSPWTIGSPWLGADCVSTAFPDHWFQNITTVAPPAALCAVQDLVLP